MKGKKKIIIQKTNKQSINHTALLGCRQAGRARAGEDIAGDNRSCKLLDIKEQVHPCENLEAPEEVGQLEDRTQDFEGGFRDGFCLVWVLADHGVQRDLVQRGHTGELCLVQRVEEILGVAADVCVVVSGCQSDEEVEQGHDRFQASVFVQVNFVNNVGLFIDGSLVKRRRFFFVFWVSYEREVRDNSVDFIRGLVAGQNVLARPGGLDKVLDKVTLRVENCYSPTRGFGQLPLQGRSSHKRGLSRHAGTTHWAALKHPRRWSSTTCTALLP